MGPAWLRAAVLGIGACACALGPACTFDPGGTPYDDDGAGGADAAGPIDAPGAPDAGAKADAQQNSTPDAGTTEGVVTCFKVNGAAPDLDGDLSDWAGVPILSFDIAAATQRLFETPSYVNSVKVGVRCRHDATKLYLALEVIDDDIRADSTELYQDDSVGVYLDAVGDALGPYGIDDHEIYFRPSDPPNVKDYGPGGASLDVGGSVLNTENGYTFEISLSKSSLGVGGALPAEIGFDLALNDQDQSGGGGDRFAYGLWFKSARPACPTCCAAEMGQRAWCDTTMFGRLRLQP